jgi:hypothetical protein
MSVNSIVVSIRSGSAPVRTPVRNSSTSSTRLSMPSENAKWSVPGSSTNFAPVIAAAATRDCSTGTIRLPVRLSTSVGVRIKGRTSATSAFIVCR